MKKLLLSMYDLEEFLKEAGAEKVHEKAVRSLGAELQNTILELLEEASVYANYAGRKRLINAEDIALASSSKRRSYIQYRGRAIKERRKAQEKGIQRQRRSAPQIMLINNMPVIKEEQDIS